MEYVKLLGSEVNNTIHHPSAPGLEGGFSPSNTAYIGTSKFKLKYLINIFHGN